MPSPEFRENILVKLQGNHGLNSGYSCRTRLTRIDGRHLPNVIPRTTHSNAPAINYDITRSGDDEEYIVGGRTLINEYFSFLKTEEFTAINNF